MRLMPEKGPKLTYKKEYEYPFTYLLESDLLILLWGKP